MAGMRYPVSHSEISTLLECEAKYDFRYGDYLAGSALRPKHQPDVLNEGRAWGAGVATWYATGDLAKAFEAVRKEAEGVSDEAHKVEALVATITEMLEDFVTYDAPAIDLVEFHGAESELDVPMDRDYLFQGRVDGFCRQPKLTGEDIWVVEFKLRRSLSRYETLVSDLQGRRYAWAYREMTGEAPAGVIFVERLNQLPMPPKMLASGKVSHDKRQKVRPMAYTKACDDAGERWRLDVRKALEEREWAKATRVSYSGQELDEIGEDLFSTTALLTEIHSQLRKPIRNVTPRCSGCPFWDVCLGSADTEEMVDALYERRESKRAQVDAGTYGAGG